MKKPIYKNWWFWVIIVVVVILIIPSGSDANDDGTTTTTTTTTSGNPSQKPSKPRFDEDKVVSQLQVTEYSLKTDFWNYSFFEIKNNSEYNIEITVNVKYYNSADELIGAKNSSVSAVGSGQTILMYFMPDEDFVRTEYDISVDEDDWFESAVSDLSYEVVTAKDKEIVSVTNNGEEPADFVQVSMLFFKNGKVVDFGWTYCVDDDSEIKPGKTITKEIYVYEAYDSYKVYLEGRR